MGINDSGIVVGFYADANGTWHGFVDKNGTFTTVDVPQAGTGPGQGTYLSAQNDPGAITGAYIDANVIYHGFTDTDGVISPVEVPGSTSNGISNTETLVGYSGNAAGTVYQGWRQARGHLTFLNDPDARLRWHPAPGHQRERQDRMRVLLRRQQRSARLRRHRLALGRFRVAVPDGPDAHRRNLHAKRADQADQLVTPE